jgi:peptidoglycan-associated lipoprotein
MTTHNLSRGIIAAAQVLLFVSMMGCAYTLPVKDGRTAYERKRFTQAIPMLEREYNAAKSRNERGQLAYQLAESYRRTGQTAASLDWYNKSYENNGGPDALRGYAYTLKQLQRYPEAREQFKQLGIEIGSPYEYRKEINACTIAEGWIKESAANGIRVETAHFNAPENDFAPTWAPDGRLLFSSDRAVAQGKSEYAWTGHRFMDMFIVEPDAASAQAFDLTLNTATHEATPAFTRKGDRICVVRTEGAYDTDDQYCRLYEAERLGDSWAALRPLTFQKDKVNYLHPAYGPDGNTLYYAANDPDGWGGYDLYVVTRQPNSATGWSEPRALSRNINTPANELFPSWDADTLYFASDGLGGMGGLDIFRTYKMDRTSWAPPINMKSPLNSGYDDFGLIYRPDVAPAPNTPRKPGDLVRSGFFTSNRPLESAKGGDDVLRFEIRVAPPAPVKRDTPPAGPIVHTLLLDIYILEKIFSEADNPNAKVLGRKPLAGTTLVIESGATRQTVSPDANGFYQLKLAEQTDYVFTAKLDGYLTNSGKFSTKGIAKSPNQPTQTFELEIVLDRIFRNREIVLENIYYDYEKSDIRPDAEPTLNRLADILRQNPTIRIQMGSHTDCRGNDGYNQNLSQARAQSAVNYLIAKGIGADRLEAIGYGERAPAADCACAKCTEPEHQTNRRTTFKVLD